jgi:hypothetical protein
MKKILIFSLLSLLIILALSNCQKEDKIEMPKVSTDSVSLVSIHTAKLYGTVNDEGGSAVTGRGFCYSAIPGADLNDSLVSSGFGPGQFSEMITGLRSGRIYYYKAYATNGKGTAFGEEKSFTTEAEVDPGPTLALKGGSGYTSGNATIPVGTTIKVGVVGGKSSVSGNKLTRFRFIYTLNNIPTTLLDSTFNSDSFNWETNLTFAGPGNVALSFELTDAANMKATRDFNVTVQAHQIIKYSNIELGSWNDAIGSFFSTSEGINYNISQTSTVPANQAKIDFLFFKGITNANTIASPDDIDANTIPDLKLNLWTNKNQTRFNTTNITAAQFDAIGANYEFPDFNINQQTTKANELMVGDVILFKTQSGKLGLIKIVDLYTKGDKMKIDVVREK